MGICWGLFQYLIYQITLINKYKIILLIYFKKMDYDNKYCIMSKKLTKQGEFNESKS